MTEVSVAFQEDTKYRGHVLPSGNDVFTPQRVVIHEVNSEWAKSAKIRLDSLVSLKPGWDGYQGIPVSFNLAYLALLVIDRLYQEGVPKPDIIPGSDGTLQIEWHVNGYDVEVDVLAANNIVASRFSRGRGVDEQVELKADLSCVWQWISELRLS